MTVRQRACLFAAPAMLAIALCLTGCAQAVREPAFISPPIGPAAALATASDAVDWEPFARTLDRHVTDAGRVDYFRMAQSPTYDALMRVYARIAEAGPASRPAAFATRNEKLAYYLNAHNLLAVLAIAPHFGPGRIDPRGVADLPGPPETGFAYTLDGQTVTLRRIRDELVTPLLEGDPRPLLGLTAGRRNDPPLRREIYAAERLDAQLADQLLRVLGEGPWCEIDYAGRQVRLPAAVTEHREFYWSGYLATPGHSRQGVQFLTVLSHFADERGRAWLRRGLGYEAAAAAPAGQINSKPLFRSGD